MSAPHFLAVVVVTITVILCATAVITGVAIAVISIRNKWDDR